MLARPFLGLLAGNLLGTRTPMTPGFDNSLTVLARIFERWAGNRMLENGANRGLGLLPRVDADVSSLGFLAFAR